MASPRQRAAKRAFMTDWTVAGVPAFAAAGLALDHPAWSGPDVDPPLGPVSVDETSWWPPGSRYEWMGQSTGRTIVKVDPWDSAATGHLWTGCVAAATGFLVFWLWWGSRPLRTHPVAATEHLN